MTPLSVRPGWELASMVSPGLIGWMHHGLTSTIPTCITDINIEMTAIVLK
jgi:hypothetical protein